jgi:hypothetical protein
MIRTVIAFALATVATGCAPAVSNNLGSSSATESSLTAPGNKKPRTLSGTGRLLVAHPS